MMSGKNLSVKGRELTPRPATKHSAHSAKDRIDQFVIGLLESDTPPGGTVDEILRHPQVKKHGLLGRLSNSQQNLVTSVVSIMQDQVSSDAKQNADALKQIIIAEREALKSMSSSFAATAKSLYKLPLLGQSKAEPERSTYEASSFRDKDRAETIYPAAPPPPPPPTFFERFLTWGNMLAFTAIILAVLVVKTSVETANYETQYRLSQENLEKLNTDHEALQADYEALMVENKLMGESTAALNVRVEELGKQQAADAARSDASKAEQLLALQEAKETITKQEAIIAKTKALNASLQLSLNKEISVLQQELAAYKGKEVQQDENYQIWKALAEERKDEISKLQTELMNVATKSMDSAAKDSQESKNSGKFLGIF